MIVYRRRAAFTLLEVIVAVAILGISLTAIFGGQAGAARTAARSNNYLIATSMARCKMGEMQELVSEQGLPGVEKHGHDHCCEDAQREDFECEWSIERIKLADYIAPPDSEPEDAEQEALEQDPSNLDPQQFMSGSMASAVGSQAISLAYPVLEPNIEENVRLAKIQMSWQEFGATKSMSLFTYMVVRP